MKIAITGHRPGKLYGYSLSDPKYTILKEKLKMIIKKYKATTAYTGMALGTDMVFANAVLDLKKEGVDIRLAAVLPCANQDRKWSKKDQKRYQEILQAADEVIQLSEEEYSPELMRVRNRWLVDHADMLIAVWDGSNSGTSNCIRYAISKIPVYRIFP